MIERLESLFFIVLFSGLTIAAIALSLVALRESGGDTVLLW